MASWGVRSWDNSTNITLDPTQRMTVGPVYRSYPQGHSGSITIPEFSEGTGFYGVLQVFDGTGHDRVIITRTGNTLSWQNAPKAFTLFYGTH